MHAFVDWNTQIPSIKPAPEAVPVGLDGPVGTFTLLQPMPPPPVCAPVQDLVIALTPALFTNLRTRCKSKGITLNGPLLTAFGFAIADTIRLQQPSLDVKSGLTVGGLVAVDARGDLVPPLPKNYISGAAGLMPCSVASANFLVDFWATAATVTSAITMSVAARQHFRLPDMLAREAYGELGPFFANVSFIWSNIGHLECPGISEVEFHLSGQGTNPIISGHCVEVDQILSLTITYSPVFHAQQDMQYIAQRFAEHLKNGCLGE